MSNSVPKVLVVEDEMIIAMDLSATLEEAGFDVIGPFHDSSAALGALQKDVPDAALLDVNLGKSGTTDAIADVLEKQGRPFAFITGYNTTGSQTLEKYPAAACLSKPVDMGEIVKWLDGTLGAHTH